MRRFLAIAVLGSLACLAAQAQQKPCPALSANNDFLGIHTIRLWPGDAPEAKGKACEDIPTLAVFDPPGGTENGSAVIVLPGGAYLGLAATLEGREFASWFAARGFRAFVLSYRLSSHGYLLPIPLLDARRAVQTVRARALDYHIDPNRIVVIGFSAGGHLAALSGTQFVPGNPDAEDPIERVSSRPDYLVLGYPWIGAISSDTSHLTYSKLFSVMDRCEALRPRLFTTPLTTRRCRWSRACASTRRWSRPAFRPRCTSSPKARMAAGWARATRLSTSGPRCLKHGCARRA